MNKQLLALTPVLPSTLEHKQSSADSSSMKTEQQLERQTGHKTNMDLSCSSRWGQPSRSVSAALFNLETFQLQVNGFSSVKGWGAVRWIEQKAAGKL